MQSRQIRVLILLDELNVGGTETHVISMARQLIQRGVHVVIAGRSGPMLPEFQKLGCPVYTHFPKGESIKQALRSIAQRHQINVIHAHQLPSGRQAKKLKEQTGIPMVFTVHGLYYKKRLLRTLLSSKGRRPIQVVSVSYPVYEWLKRQGIHSRIIQNGIDIQQYCYQQPMKLRQELNIPYDVPLLLYSSRLAWDKLKLCRQFLASASQVKKRYFPQLRIVLVGSGKYEGRIQQLIQEIHENHQQSFIHFLGARHDMPALYSASNCVVGTGRVALEAMGCERPVIALGTKGFFGLVQPSNYKLAWKTYFCDHKAYLPFNQNLLTTQIAYVLASTDRQNHLGQLGRNYVAQQYQVVHSVQQTLLLYQSLLSQPMRRQRKKRL
ncbi:glycosyltransferase [Caldalkalibacillus salinus]|uniref:glycosyltransferase n=1 Tax=Caldalkalibacillus salinus TaxID=2803787 RepID=UPI0019240BDC|nr:glycosyltransferase [Caldalkalibacillus salinus]